MVHIVWCHRHDGHRLLVDRLDDAVGFSRHDREQRVVTDVGHLLGPSIAGRDRGTPNKSRGC